MPAFFCFNFTFSRFFSILFQQELGSHHKTYARLLSVYLLFSNRVGYEDGVNFWGGSEVVNSELIIRRQKVKYPIISDVVCSKALEIISI